MGFGSRPGRRGRKLRGDLSKELKEGLQRKRATRCTNQPPHLACVLPVLKRCPAQSRTLGRLGRRSVFFVAAAPLYLVLVRSTPPPPPSPWFFEGASHYDDALAGSGLHNDIVCAPDTVTRKQATAVFIQYIKDNPQYGREPPIDAIFRALIAKWPCAE